MPARLSVKIRRALKAFRQLPKRQALNYLLYRLELDSGWLKLRTPAPEGVKTGPPARAYTLFTLPEPAALAGMLDPQGLDILRQQADEIAAGQVRLFGGPPVSLQLDPPPPLAHWADLERGQHDLQHDVKLIWEPARFGWASTLARAYHLLQDEKYTHAFWQHTNRFLDANPAYQGWNWTSAQEVGLRLIALVYALHVFQHAPETRSNDRQRLQTALAQHARRLPLSLAYARAQNNNHLLSESAAMYTAGCLLDWEPQAVRWRKRGWHIFHQGLQRQIDPQGVYIQHSANYTRLMLQLALWVKLLAESQQQTFPPLSQERLAQATRWLFNLLDQPSGEVPNLGPNDGAYILPLTIQPFRDYRPVLQAAGRAFLNQAILSTGPWDEMAGWLVAPAQADAPARALQTLTPHTLRDEHTRAWAYLRAANFHSRPGHADQLHLDLWWQGHNLSRDPGTFRYNAAPPWDNALVHSEVHSTVTINGQDQMTPAGRFLFLDWAQAQISEYVPADQNSIGKISASHDGYQPLGWQHQRTLKLLPDHSWQVTDRLLPVGPITAKPATVRLHWLLPDWDWSVERQAGIVWLTLQSPAGEVRLEITAQAGPAGASQSIPILADLYRAGECLYGDRPGKSTWGWYSPTYNLREPALALACSLESRPPLTFETRILLPGAVES